jgi:nucleotide-binding universal stress UspA family protein
MGTIVVGTDGSPGSREAIEWAVQEASFRDAKVLLLHALDLPAAATLYLSSAVEVDRAAEDLVAHATEYAQRLAGEGPPIEIEGTVRSGSPAWVLIEASRSADLLVVGSRGHGAFAGLLLGSVSFHCVSHAVCPVVVVRSTEE